MADNEPIDDIVAKLDALEASFDADIARATTGKQAVRAAKEMLRPLTQEEPAEFVGKLADAVRKVLRSSEASHSPLEVRDALVKINYDLTKHDNPMAAIHSVLKRMKDSATQEVKDKVRKDGTTAYYWIGERSIGDLIASKIGEGPGVLSQSSGLTEMLQRIYEEQGQRLKDSMQPFGITTAPKPPNPIKTGGVYIPAKRKPE